MAKTIIIKNNSGNPVEVKNLPLRPIADAAQVEISAIMNIEDIYRAAADRTTNSFGFNVEQGILTINDGTDDLSIQQALSFLTLEQFLDFRHIIYLSAEEGDDNNDGLNENTPVKTIGRAHALAEAISSNIWVMIKAVNPGTFTISSLTPRNRLILDLSNSKLNAELLVFGSTQGIYKIRETERFVSISSGVTLDIHKANAFVSVQGDLDGGSIKIDDLNDQDFLLDSGTTGSLDIEIHNASDTIPEPPVGLELSGSINGRLYGDLDLTIDEISGVLPQNRVTDLVKDLAEKATSPHDTDIGRFPKYADDFGNLDEGVSFVGAGTQVVTTDIHGKLPPDIFRDENTTPYPALPPSGYTADVNLNSGNIDTFLNNVNLMDGTDLTVTIDEAVTIPTKTDFSNDTGTTVFANLNATPLSVVITDVDDSFRINSGTIAGDLSIPQFHYVQLTRLSVGSDRVHVLKFEIIPFTAPNTSILITNFSIDEDVPLGTVITGVQTLTFEVLNQSNIENDSLDVVINGTAGGAGFGEVVDASAFILTEGTNELSFAIPTDRTLSQDGDFYRIDLSYSQINPNLTASADDEWRIDARSADHPSQGTFKYGWITVEPEDLTSTTIDSVSTYDESDVETAGPVTEDAIPVTLTVPGVDVDGKRFLIEVQADIGEIETIVENVGTAFETAVYDSGHPLSATEDFNSIAYSKDVNGQSKDFVLLYTRSQKLEIYEGQVLEIHKEA